MDAGHPSELWNAVVTRLWIRGRWFFHGEPLIHANSNTGAPPVAGSCPAAASVWRRGLSDVELRAAFEAECG